MGGICYGRRGGFFLKTVKNPSNFEYSLQKFEEGGDLSPNHPLLATRLDFDVSGKLKTSLAFEDSNRLLADEDF
jgi:hypothetical protein